MRALVLLLLLLLPMLLLPTGEALAQSAIHRCVDAHGNPVFTDRTCASQQATPVTSSAADVPAATGTPPMPPATLCAASLPALKQAVIDAFAGRDPNRLAGLMLWRGYGSHSVVADIRSLGQLMQQPLLGIHVVGGDDEDTDATDPPASTGGIAGEAPVAAAAPALILSTSDAAGGPPQQSTFPVVARAGCLWLRPPG
jgi:hypothetical protein